MNHLPKDEFHRAARKALKEIAKQLNMAPGSFEIRSDKGGIAVRGDVILHHDSIYIDFGGDCLKNIMFRSCKGRKDYTGGVNQFVSYDVFRVDTAGCLNKFKAAMEKYY